MKKVHTLIKKNVFLSKDGEIPKQFEKLIWGTTDLMGLRIMVDPLNGDDSNDGTTWDTAFKSLYKAASMLPEDLGGRHAIILMHPGEHLVEEAKTPRINCLNGMVRLVWVGTFINESEGNADAHGYCEWVRNGKSNPIRNNEQVRLKFAPGVTDTWTLLSIGGDVNKTLGVSFGARDFNLDWNVAGCFFWDRFVFEGYSDRTPASYPSLLNAWGVSLSQDGDFTLDLKSTRIACEFNNCSGFFTAMKVIGGDGEASTSTSSWRSIIHLGNGTDLMVKTGGYGYAVGFEPEHAMWEFKNFKSNLLSVFNSTGAKVNLAHLSTSYCYVDNSEIGDVKIGISLTSSLMAGSSISFNNSFFNLVDSAVEFHTIKEYASNNSLVSSKTYLSPSIIDDGENFIYDGGAIFNLPASDPLIIGALWNDSGTVKVSAG